MNVETSNRINVVCFKWTPSNVSPARKMFTSGHVNALKIMVDKHLEVPHRLICITDDPKGLDADIDTVSMPPAYLNMKGCYPKIALFSHEIQKDFDERILYIDLDCVITKSLDELLPDTNTDFLIHGKRIKYSAWDLLSSKTKRRQRTFYKNGIKYNGGMMYFRKNSHDYICEDFNEEEASALGKHYHVRGEDQVWVAYKVGFPKRIWTRRDGVYSYVSDMSGRKRETLPDDAKIVLFGGSYKPWDESVISASPWIQEHYPLKVL